MEMPNFTDNSSCAMMISFSLEQLLCTKPFSCYDKTGVITCRGSEVMYAKLQKCCNLAYKGRPCSTYIEKAVHSFN